MSPSPHGNSIGYNRSLNSEFFAQLVCPSCRKRLVFDDTEHTLTCEACREQYPIIAGIPRFVTQEHLASFGLQWNRYEIAHDEEDQTTFQAKTSIKLAELKGLRVLDAGCGGGRYSRIAGQAGATVVAADHSSSVDKASSLCQHLEGVQFIQADLKRLPLASASFDFVFSVGVMHHDVDTRSVFDAVARMVRPGGRMAVWLYRRNQGWQEAINNCLRKRARQMSVERLQHCCQFGAWLGGIPLVNKTLNKLVNFSNHPHWENRVCDTFDWYAPTYQHHHTIDELSTWFREAGFDDLVVLPPEKTGTFYRWAYTHDLIIGSGVNVCGRLARPLP